jgi:uncharacterized repeat protein (TIGR03803 family)
MMSTRRFRGAIPRILLRPTMAMLSLAALLLVISATQWMQAQTFTVLYTFKGQPDGAYPVAQLTRDANGNLYGTTGGGGTYGYGTVFKLSPRGEETVLYSFAGGTDGESPYGGVVQDAEGNLYGTTNGGGYPECDYGYGCGTVFKVDKHGKESVLYRFGTMPDGNFPEHETLCLDHAGNLYGTTGYGGDSNCDPGYGCGIAFKLDKNGRETILHTFTGTEELDGAFPFWGFVGDAKGNLYSTTEEGGAPGCPGENSKGCGTVFKLDKAGKETVLHRFSPDSSDGGPLAGVIRDNAGNLYGIATGGSNFYGRVFKLNKWDKETELYSFSYEQANYLTGGLARDASGNLYGTTVEGKSYDGMVFKLDMSGNLTVLHNFAYGDGAFPEAPLIVGEDGNLYGATRSGGNSACYYGCGVVFKITP